QTPCGRYPPIPSRLDRTKFSATLRRTKTEKSFFLSNRDGHTLLKFRGAGQSDDIVFCNSTQDFVIRGIGDPHFHIPLSKPVLLDDEHIPRVAVARSEEHTSELQSRV